MGLLNSPLVNLLTGKPINWNSAIGSPLVNPGGLSGRQSTGNTVYDALTNTNAQPIKSTSATVSNSSTWQSIAYQIFIGIVGLGIIIMGFIMLAKTDLKINIAKGVI